MAISEPQVWPGSSSFSPGDTPYGFYDNDSQFQLEIDNFADWAAKRLGYPNQDVELRATNFYSAFEEAVSEYGAQLNSFNARDQLINLMGLPTASLSLEQEYVTPTLQGQFKLAKEYGTAAGTGGNLEWYTGSIAMVEDKQVYDLLDTGSVSLETGSFQNDTFTIRKIFHEEDPASTRYVDPSYGGIGAFQQLLGEFGWSNMGVPMSYMLMPMHHDVLRLQAIEFYRMVRRSAYSFKLTGNRLRIFPIPNASKTLYFHYTLDDDILAANTASGSSKDKISDYGNIPYANIKFSRLNSMSKQWIRNYAFASVKEMLGRIYSKYDSLPIPDNEIQLNGDALLSEAKDEKENLIEKLIELLESMTKKAQLERQKEEGESLQDQLSKVPSKIYTG